MNKISALVLILVAGLSCYPARDGNGKRLVRINLEAGGRARYALLHVPANRPAGPCPLLLVLHGGGGKPEGMVSLTKGRFNERADGAGFYVAYPEGLRRSWNDFRNDEISYAHREKIDDAGFLSALIDRIAADYPIDRNRVFATGISNGGFMSYRLACQLSDRIRGIAAVAATHPADQEGKCAPSRPMDIMIINGTGDPIVPYNGGEVELLGSRRGRVVSTDDTVRFWTAFNRCPGNPSVQDLPAGDADDSTRVRKISYGPCSGGTRVVLFRVEGGGHAWPGGYHYLPTGLIGHTSRGINACDEIWNFFSGAGK